MRILLLAVAALLPSVLSAQPLIVVVGDSLSAGYGVDAGQSFPDHLQRMLTARGYNYKVVNQSISGDTTAGGLSRIARATDLKPAIMILELGGNDGLRGLPVSQTKSNLERMIIASQKVGSLVFLAGLTLPPNYGQAYVKQFENMYPDLAAQYKTGRIRFLLEGVVLVPGMMQRDGIHPTARGCAKVAQNVFESLLPVLKK